MPNTFITTSAPFIQTQYTAPVDALVTVGGDSTYDTIANMVKSAVLSGAAELIWNNSRVLDVTTGIINKLYTLSANPTTADDWHSLEEYSPIVTVLGRSKEAISNILGSIPISAFYISGFIKGGLYLVTHQTASGKENGVYIANTTSGTSTTFTRYPELPNSNIPIQRTIVHVQYDATDSLGSGHFYRCDTGALATAYTYYKDDYINNGLIEKVSGGLRVNGTIAATGLTASKAVATDSSSMLVSVTNIGTGNNVLADNPTLTTPVLGAATATSINRLTITDTGGTGTLTIPNGSSLIRAGAHALTLTTGGTSIMTFPTATDTVVTLAASQVLTNKRVTLTAGTISIVPLKFASGTNLTTPEAGAVEWDGTNLYVTQTSGPSRKTIAYTDSTVTGASTIVVADETTDTTCFPVFVTAATGTLSPKSNTTLKYNSTTGNFESTIFTAGTSFLPDTNDGASLGATGQAFTKLWLASTGGIDFGAGNLTFVHSSGYGTFNKDIRITTIGTDTTSIVTVGGAQTLTSKQLTSPGLNEATTLTSTSTKLNYLTSATGTTGTASSNIVFSNSPTFTGSPRVTPAYQYGLNNTGLSKSISLATSNSHFFQVTSGTGLLNLTVTEYASLADYDGTSFLFSVITTTSNITVKFDHTTTIMPGVGGSTITLIAGTGLTYSGIIFNGTMYGVVSSLFANLL